MRIWTIELNLNDDPLNSCAWHIDDLKTTCLTNFRHAVHGQTVDKWVLVGVVESDQIPFEEADKLRRVIAQQRLKEGIDKELREPYGVEAVMNQWISINDESLPNPRERVLICSSDGVHSGYWDGYCSKNPSWQCDPIGSYAGDGCVFNVTHWMPLPKPPEPVNAPVR